MISEEAGSFFDQTIRNEVDRAWAALEAHPEWDADKFGDFGRHWVRTMRCINSRMVPPLTTHREIVRWAHEAALLLHWSAAPEEWISLGGRRGIVPDLVLRRRSGAPATHVIEVKRRVVGAVAATRAARQVARYNDFFAVRQSEPITTAVVALHWSPAAVEAMPMSVRVWTPDDLLAVLVDGARQVFPLEAGGSV